MTDFSFIIDNIKFSNSSVNSFETCNLMFKLSYIEAKDKINNFFAEYGSHVHLTLEKYFSGELEIFQLSNYYVENFTKNIISPPPPFPANLVSNYFEQGLIFFNDFDWDRDKLEILFREEFVDSEVGGIKLTIKPDLVIKEKETSQIVLMDYKTASIKKGKYIDKKKLEEYKKQMFLYSYILGVQKSIKIDKIRLLFIREPGVDQIQEVCYTKEDGERTINEFLETIKKIKIEQEWKPNFQSYFCQNICSQRLNCWLYLSKFGVDLGNEFDPNQ